MKMAGFSPVAVTAKYLLKHLPATLRNSESSIRFVPILSSKVVLAFIFQIIINNMVTCRVADTFFVDEVEMVLHLGI